MTGGQQSDGAFLVKALGCLSLPLPLAFGKLLQTPGFLWVTLCGLGKAFSVSGEDTLSYCQVQSRKFKCRGQERSAVSGVLLPQCSSE